MRRIRHAAAVAMLLLLVGCPLASDHPAGDSASAPLDTALLGTWEGGDPNDRDVFTLTITPFNEHELLGIGREAASDGGADGGAVTAFRLFVTEIGSARFLNILELTNEDDPQWYFARYSVKGDTLRLRLVDDALFPSGAPPSPRELRAVFAAHLDDDALYGGSDSEAPATVLQRRARAASRPAPGPTF